ncbi:unnamed protein product, partial [Rotaria sp. Silwood2]
ERKCQYWGLILKLCSFSSDTVRETFIKILPLIINDKRLSGYFHVFGTNCYLTQNVLFEYFTNDELLCSSNDLFINFMVNLFNNLLRNIHSSYEDEISMDRCLWPSSEDESCVHYCALNINKTIDMIRDQSNRLILIQIETFNQFFIRQRSTVRLNLIIRFLYVTKSLHGIKLEQLPQQWTFHH